MTKFKTILNEAEEKSDVIDRTFGNMAKLDNYTTKPQEIVVKILNRSGKRVMGSAYIKITRNNISVKSINGTFDEETLNNKIKKMKEMLTSGNNWKYLWLDFFGTEN